VTADYYSILGVSPAAEDVVIGAAYRALIRHYHPDTNPDPAAQVRAREITAAYNVLRNPVSRAKYDADRGVELWDEEEEPRAPPPMRTVGIAATLLAFAVAAAMWFWPPDPAPVPGTPSSSPPKVVAHELAPEPIVPLRPENERLAEIDRATAPAPPPIIAPETIAPDIPVAEPPLPLPRAARSPAPVLRRKPAVVTATGTVKAPARSRSERVAMLDRMARNYFTQSLIYAPDKTAQLQAAQDRSEAQRKACRSDSCVADAYVRQIRETSAIMEPKSPRKD